MPGLAIRRRSMKGKIEANAGRWMGALKLPLGACLLLLFAATGSWARQCPSGQFYRVSKHVCISKAEAEKLGIYHRPAQAKKPETKATEEQAKPAPQSPPKPAKEAVKPESAPTTAKPKQSAAAPAKDPPAPPHAIDLSPAAAPPAHATPAAAATAPAAPSPFGSLTIENFPNP
jgi:hypothetical protein